MCVVSINNKVHQTPIVADLWRQQRREETTHEWIRIWLDTSYRIKPTSESKAFQANPTVSLSCDRRDTTATLELQIRLWRSSTATRLITSKPQLTKPACVRTRKIHNSQQLALIEGEKFRSKECSLPVPWRRIKHCVNNEPEQQYHCTSCSKPKRYGSLWWYQLHE